ncbi:MAG: DNA translocase FtsK, partial [Ruminococcaceae bacterium]|nr:DNA translocase FtsK [Oscillospiraceae bacterium]
NIPSRIALSVSSQIDSRTILDSVGAEKLLGNGDMLFNPVGASKPTRVQGCFISDAEVERVVNHIKSQAQTTYNEETIHEIEAKAAAAESAKKKVVDDDEDGDWDPMLNDAIEVVVNAGGASTTMLQKKLKLGYARASRVMDQLEEKGIVGPSEGAKPRAVLVTKQQWYEMQALSDGAGAPSIDDVFADDDDYSGSDDDFV